MPINHRAELARIQRFDQLVRYLRDHMGWPIDGDDFEELTFDYTAEELGINPENAAKIQEIKRLRPLSARQPWGIFFVKFEPKHLPVVALRRVLSQVAIRKRASANAADRAGWEADDLLFVSNYGQGGSRQISFAHFARPASRQDLPTLKVLGWDNQDTPLHLDAVARELTENLAWPQDDSNVDEWRHRWRSAFTLGHREVITTAERLSIRLAELAGAIRDRIRAAMAIESPRGPLRRLMKAFQESLVHDLDAEGFADMYAQTISYGLLSSRIADPTKKTADDFAAHMRTSPFLRELMQTFLKVGGRQGKADGAGIDFDELGVSEVVELLDQANMEAVLRDFGDRNRHEDPVIHFFEGFLQAYDKRIRRDRGVFYTPQPVVSYIVRSVHELLQTEFGLQDGLADTATWGEMLKRHPRLKLPPLTAAPNESRTISPDEPFIQILDPATGTATFLVEVIDVIHRTLTAKWSQQRLTDAQQRAAWNHYVPQHLLPRLHAYELMMAPYAIAHMKIGLKLAETGYRFGTEERARIYLTNALEPWVKQLPLIGFEALAHEAAAVNEVKREKRFTVIIGNPPYSGASGNMTEAAQRLIERYRFVNGAPLGERKLWLQNDYVKFLGYAHQLILDSGIGCLGYITDNSYLDGPTFRGVRAGFLTDFQSVNVLNLHGSAKKLTATAGAVIDQNVFEITQGVAIVHGVRSPSRTQSRFCSASLLGSRLYKYDYLSKQSVIGIEWLEHFPASPFFQFTKTKLDGKAEFDSYFSIKTAFPLHSVGIQTSRDDLAIGFTNQELFEKIREFSSPKSTDAEIRERYFPRKRVGDYLAGDTRGWSLSAARKQLQSLKRLDSEIVRIHYRPFDFRSIFNSTLLVDWPRPEVSEQMLSGNNLGLCVVRRTENAREYDYFSVSRNTISNHQVSLKDGTYLLPLYLESVGSADRLFTRSGVKQPNFAPSFVRAIALALNLPQEGPHELPVGITPEDIFHYAYAVFYSPEYRSRYADFLKVDFPRLPLTGSLALFRALARLGGELTALHLLESPKLNQRLAEFTGSVNPEVERVSWSCDSIWVDKAQTTGFSGVSEPVWNFHIGGYQVCEKWLKDRKGRKLSKDDIAHYQKVVVALSETIRLMAEIDEVIAQHGGWPGAFASTANRPSELMPLRKVAEPE